MKNEIEHGDQRSPIELNTEFRKILDHIPEGTISMVGTIMDSRVDEALDTLGLPKSIGPIDPYDPWPDLKARGKETTDRRLNGEYAYAVLNKLADLSHRIQGTEMFRTFYVPRAIRDSLVFGIGEDKSGHILYGDEEGGIFNPDSVEGIEEKGFQRYWDDIKWRGVSLFGGFIKPIENDFDHEKKHDMIDKAKVWQQQFLEKYGRLPKNVFGVEIIIP